MGGANHESVSGVHEDSADISDQSKATEAAIWFEKVRVITHTFYFNRFVDVIWYTSEAISGCG
jgi:hypothetical protein